MIKVSIYDQGGRKHTLYFESIVDVYEFCETFDMTFTIED